jgi:hypothetical protein
MTRSVMREHIFKILFRAEFYDAQEMEFIFNLKTGALIEAAHQATVHRPFQKHRLSLL